VIAAYRVNDAAVDPFKLSIENIAHAQEFGAVFLPHRQVVGFDRRNGRIRRVHLHDTRTGRKSTVRAEQVISACGAWAGDIAALCGLQLPMVYSKGSLLVTQERIARRVINRLRLPADGDILVPGGTVSILGTTSVRIRSLASYRPSVAEVDRIIAEGTAMIPQLENIRYIRAYCGIRPLIESRPSGDDRSVSRGFALIDHRGDGIQNLVTITGGKLTTFRLMAEKAADLVCRRLGVSQPCRTRTEALPVSDHGRWTEPGLTPRYWFVQRDPDDMLLCECEMIPKSVVDRILQSLRKQHLPPSLKAIGLRSRLGKGPCQGAFCGARVTAALYDQRQFDARRGIAELKAFIDSRWRGQRTLMWGASIVQAELQEAMQCGFLGLELEADGQARDAAPGLKPVKSNAFDE
jgi:glycerol-3-phosphate dehydrogenase